jgi:hypothetical protein
VRHNFAEVNTTAADLAARAAVVDACLQAGKPCELHVACGVNDFYLNSRTAAAAYADLAAYCVARRAAGWKVALYTALPFGPLSGPQEAERKKFNARVVGTSLADRAVDVASRPEFADPTSLRYFDADQIHPNDRGHAAYALAAS